MCSLAHRSCMSASSRQFWISWMICTATIGNGCDSNRKGGTGSPSHFRAAKTRSLVPSQRCEADLLVQVQRGGPILLYRLGRHGEKGRPFRLTGLRESFKGKKSLLWALDGKARSAGWRRPGVKSVWQRGCLLNKPRERPNECRISV